MATDFEFPDPHYDQQAQALREAFERGGQAIEILRNAGMQQEAARLAIRGLVELSNRAYTMARTLGLHEIAEGRMSRVGLGQEMGVHQGTVAKWVKKAQADPNRDYIAEPLIPHLDREAS